MLISAPTWIRRKQNVSNDLHLQEVEWDCRPAEGTIDLKYAHNNPLPPPLNPVLSYQVCLLASWARLDVVTNVEIERPDNAQRGLLASGAVILSQGVAPPSGRYCLLVGKPAHPDCASGVVF